MRGLVQNITRESQNVTWISSFLLPLPKTKAGIRWRMGSRPETNKWWIPWKKGSEIHWEIANRKTIGNFFPLRSPSPPIRSLSCDVKVFAPKMLMKSWKEKEEAFSISLCSQRTRRDLGAWSERQVQNNYLAQNNLVRYNYTSDSHWINEFP